MIITFQTPHSIDLSLTCLPEGETSISARQKEEGMCLHKLVVYKGARIPRSRINGCYERRIRNWARLKREVRCVRRVSEITTASPRYHEQMFSQGPRAPGESGAAFFNQLICMESVGGWDRARLNRSASLGARWRGVESFTFDATRAILNFAIAEWNESGALPHR